MANPSQSTVRALAYNTEHRGRPIGRDEQSRRHITSFEDASTSGSRITQPTTTSRGRGRCGSRSVVRNPPIHDTYNEKLPVDLQRYISHTVDVQPDGHCRFRAIAALIGYNEEGWSQVRLELIEEIQQNKDLYDQLYLDQNLVANLLFSLNWFEPWAPEMYWMDSMPLEIVIASRYNLVLHTFGENIASCFTHLPLRAPPVPNQERREIAIAHVGNHFMQVFLHPHYPVPPIPTWWWQHSSYEAKGWAARYRTRVHLWHIAKETTSPLPSPYHQCSLGCLLNHLQLITYVARPEYLHMDSIYARLPLHIGTYDCGMISIRHSPILSPISLESPFILTLPRITPYFPYTALHSSTIKGRSQSFRGMPKPCLNSESSGVSPCLFILALV
ncbi:hypothetical protein Acr_04g0003990 [Actinidia rufa]|uniref:OTU domain-containing protein n=1 Tax=Actinidia rufa TaxID=165716 RepID=A0A7J0EGT5_9ERIC|nr:hypothetical protein Acr_04g0003990 [Actinidia rufa]